MTTRSERPKRPPIASLVIAALLLGSILVLANVRNGNGVGIAIAMAGIAIVWGLILYFRAKGSLEWLRLRVVDFRECPKCRAPLDGLADSGDCPECATLYDHARLREHWTEAHPAPARARDVTVEAEAHGLIHGRGPRRSDIPWAPSRWAIWIWLVLWIASMILIMSMLAPGWVSMLIHQVTFAGLAMTVLSLVAERRRGRVVARDLRECTRCGFDLRGLGDRGLCPECRRAFTARSLHAYWLTKLGISPTVSLNILKDRWLASHPEDLPSEAKPSRPDTL